MFLCSESSCTYTSIGREREGRKNVRSYGMMQEQKTHSPWNALQDNENISIIKTHRTTCAAKMSNNAFVVPLAN